MSHLDTIARKCFEEEVWKEAWQESLAAGLTRGLFSIFCIALVIHLLAIPQDLFYGLVASTLIAVNSAWLNWHFEEEMIILSSAIAAAFKSPAAVRRHMRAYRSRTPAVVMRVCTFAVREYREQITAERERALGEDSEWAGKQEAIRRASDGAGGAVVYWGDRLRQEPGSQEAGERLDAASDLSRMLVLELRSLDEHAKAVERSCDECRDKVDAIERRIRDVEQIRQIGEASATAASGKALAVASVKEIAEELFEEAESVGVALADLSRLRVATAPEAASDNVEQLAAEAFQESERVGKGISAPKATPKRRPPAPAPSTPRVLSKSPEMPARTSQAEEERQMKELVTMLRRVADVLDRRAHDLRFRDEYNSEADDREELAEKMKDLADDIEMFGVVNERMKEWRAQNL